MKQLASLALLACAAVLPALPADAATLRLAGEPVTATAKAALPGRFKSASTPTIASLRLAPLEAAARAQLDAPRVGDDKRELIGVARTTGRLPDLRWSPAPGGLVARLAIASPDALSLRVGLRVRELPAGSELRFQGARTDLPVLGPLGAEAILAASRRSGVYWTPVTDGESQSIEVWIPAGSDPARVRLALEGASHLQARAAERFAKSAGRCHEDVACVAGGNEALQRAARSVAKMVFTENGATYTCTGTLVNDAEAANQVPYFYTAAHCIDSQAAAASLNTFWFYEAPACGTKSAGAFKQLTGGASLLHANAATDAALLRLAELAPDGAWFSGWDATALSSGTAVVGIHHPQGEVKKVAMGLALAATAGAGGESYATATWLGGSTEGGSSGSGLFSLSGGEYLLRGGLKGGSASCSVSGRPDDPANRDYYSRLDLEATTLSAWLTSGPTPLDDYTDMWWSPDEPGWGVSIVQHASNRTFVAWYAYDAQGRPTWMVSPDAQWRGATVLEGTLYRTTGSSPESAYDAAKYSATPAGTMRLDFAQDDTAGAQFTVDGRAIAKRVRRQAY